MSEPSNADRLVSAASTLKLQRTMKIYQRIVAVTFPGTFISLALGVWIDWRWIPTAGIIACVWTISNGVIDKIRTELIRRETSEGTAT